MRFTQEDLLNAAGLKLGDKILFAFYGSPVTVSYNEQDGFHFMADNGKHFYTQTLIDHDYTRIIQPKYTLTETEKHIVLAIDEKWKWIARDRDGLHIYTTLPKFDYCFSDFGCTYGYTEYFNVFIDNFEYVIENQEPVSLDELREIAKK